MKFRLIFGVATLAIAASADMAFAQDGDPEAGEKVFRKCQVCHMVGDDAKSLVGPPLNDLFGRQAGTYQGFDYSPVTTQAGENGLVWNEETLGAYLEKPREYIPGNPMAYPGLRKAEDRQNVIAYLKQFDDEPDNDDAESTYSSEWR